LQLPVVPADCVHLMSLERSLIDGHSLLAPELLPEPLPPELLDDPPPEEPLLLGEPSPDPSMAPPPSLPSPPFGSAKELRAQWEQRMAAVATATTSPDLT
jgi:hypothetical protein